MAPYAFLILTMATIASSQIDDDMEICWRESYGRGAGTIPNYCKAGFELQGALCYPLCAENYTGVGPVCWENCPPGYKDIGALCVGQGKTIAKKSYGRGAGDIPGCAPNLQEDAGLCYQLCKDTFKGVGPVCWKEGSGNATIAVECNPVSYGVTQADCDELNNLLKQGGITSVVCIGSVAASIAAGHVVGPKVCRDLITKILPKLKNTHIC